MSGPIERSDIPALLFENNDAHRAEAVVLSISNHQLEIHFLNRSTIWSRQEIHWDFYYPGVAKIIHRSGATLEVRRADCVAYLRNHFGHHRWYLGGRLTSKFWVSFLVLTALTLSLYLFYSHSRGLSSWVAQKIPLSWEKRALGVFEFPSNWKACENEPTRKILDDLVAKTSAKINFPYPVRIHLVSMDMSNAFTVTGGEIYFTTPLLKELKAPEEMLAILGHEMGHLYHRHVLANFIRGASLTVFLNLVLGSITGLIPMDPGTVSQLMRLKFGREDEFEADQFSAQFLEANGLSPHYLADFLERLSKNEKLLSGLEWMSTHPLSSDRVARLSDSNPQAVKPRVPDLLTLADWKQVQDGCQ